MYGSPGEARYGAVPIIEFEFSVVILSPLNNVELKLKWLRRTLSTWSSTLFLFSPAWSSPSPSSASLPVSIWGQDKTTRIELIASWHYCLFRITMSLILRPHRRMCFLQFSVGPQCFNIFGAIQVKWHFWPMNGNLLLQKMSPNQNRCWMTNRNTAKVFYGNESNLQMHRMKIWGNKVVAENNKVLKKENDMAEKWLLLCFEFEILGQVYMEEWLTDCRATLLKKCKALMKVACQFSEPGPHEGQNVGLV